MSVNGAKDLQWCLLRRVGSTGIVLSNSVGLLLQYWYSYYGLCSPRAWRLSRSGYFGTPHCNICLLVRVQYSIENLSASASPALLPDIQSSDSAPKATVFDRSMGLASLLDIVIDTPYLTIANTGHNTLCENGIRLTRQQSVLLPYCL